jgi:peptidoglycan/xylan/chitin deacetylase (PgdA/CDA1 family)
MAQSCLVILIALSLFAAHSNCGSTKQGTFIEKKNPKSEKKSLPNNKNGKIDNSERTVKVHAPERSPKSGLWDVPVITNCKNKKHLAFTFDDGINEGTGRALHWLNKNNIKATFFVLGTNVVNKA